MKTRPQFQLPSIEPTPGGKLSLGPMLREVMRDEQLLHKPAHLRLAAWLMILQPLALALVMFASKDTWVETLLLGETLLTGLLGASLLSKRREALRRRAFLLVMLNGLFLLVFAYITGNSLLQLVQCSWFFAQAWLLQGRYPRPRARAVALGLAVFPLIWALSVAGFARWQMTVAADAYQAGDRQGALDALELGALAVELCGPSKADLSLLAFRRAELALELGLSERSGELIREADGWSRNLPGPPLCAATQYGADQSIGYALKNRGVVDFYARDYELRAWGVKPEFARDPLGSYRLYASDDVAWMQGLLAPVGDGLTAVPACSE